jgi:hypothetical protein
MKRPKGRKEKLRLDQLYFDATFQHREGAGTVVDPDHAEGIRAALKEAKEARRKPPMDPVKVCRVKREDMPEEIAAKFPNWQLFNVVYDGFHTCEGYRRAGARDVPCEVLPGTYEDAFFHSVGANSGHLAKHRSRADKEKAIKNCIEFNGERGRWWSQDKVAEACNVDRHTVAEVIKRFDLKRPTKDGEVVKAEGRDGKHRPAPKAPPRKASEPEAEVTMSGSWREMPLDEMVDIVPDYMTPKLRDKKIITAGQLFDAVRKGQLLGFIGGDGKECLAKLDKMRQEHEVRQKPQKQGAVLYDWRATAETVKRLIRSVDDIKSAYPEAEAHKIEACHRNLEAFHTVFEELKATLTRSSK